MAKLWSAMWFHKNCFYMKFLQRFFVFLPPLPPEMSVWICQSEILTISFNIYIIGYKLYIIICILLTYIVYTYYIYIYIYIYILFMYIYIVSLHAYVLSHVWPFATPCTVPYQAPLSMGFWRQEYWSGMPFPPPGNLPNPEIKPGSPATPALAVNAFTTEPPGNPHIHITYFSSSYGKAFKPLS